MTQECIIGTDARQLRFVGDPVDIVTGTLADSVVDIAVAGRPSIVWRRLYSSGPPREGPFGHGSALALDRGLRVVVDGILYTRPGADELVFAYPRPGEAYPPQAGHTLEFSQTGLSRVHKHNGEIDEFTPADDLSARLHRIVDRAGALELRYDGEGRLLRVTGADAARALRIEWIGARVDHLSIARPGRTSSLVLIRYEYDDRGRLVGVIDHYGARQRFDYDDQHRMIARCDRGGYRFEYAYDQKGRCVSAGGHDGVAAVTLRYMPEAQATLVTQADGGEWLYRYDESATITEIIDPLGGKRSFTFHDDGRLHTETDAGGHVREAMHDAGGEVVAWRTARGGLRPASSPSGALPHRAPQRVCELELGHCAARVTAKAPFASPGVRPLLLHGGSMFSKLFAERDARGEHACRRDVAGVLLRETREGASARTWGYTPNGWIQRYGDHEGGRYEFSYASWNHRIAARDPLGRTIRYEYTKTEKIAAICGPGGNRHEYRYDLRGELIEVHHAGELVETYRHDQAGRLVEKRDAAGERLVSYEYGPEHTLKTRRRLACGAEHRYTYTASGQVATIDDGEHLCEFAYAPGGERRQDHRDGRGVSHRVALGHVALTTILERFTIRYERTSARDLTIIDPTGGRHLFEIGADGAVHRHFACGYTEVARYDARGRCLGKHLFAPAPRAPVWRRRFAYSPEGDLMSIDDSEVGVTRFSYDAARQLAEEHMPEGGVATYGYDDAGNLIDAPHLIDAEIGPGNKLLRANGNLLTYDRRNNVATWTRDGRVLRFHRDALDQLRTIEGLEHPWTAEYDPLGRRIRKTYGAASIEYFWDTDFLAAELHSDGRLRLYIRVHDFALVPWLVVDYDAVDADPAKGRCYYLLSDHRGAPIAALDDQGARVWSAVYAPYGQAETRGELAITQRLAGQVCDPETGLHYHRFRYYSPELARYLEEDPVGMGGGLGRYTYTTNPLVEFDARGLACEVCGAKGRCEDHPPKKTAVGKYELNPKHGSRARGDASPAPKNGQAALDTSIKISENSTRRVGIDYDAGGFVVFPEHEPRKFHGYSVHWTKLTQKMQSVLRAAGMVNKKGRILTRSL
jgi:RHS repeat-associated protein